MTQLAKTYPGAVVVMLAKSQAALFGQSLQDLGFAVNFIQSADYPAACAGLVDLVATGELAHLGDIDLSAAAEAGPRRILEGGLDEGELGVGRHGDKTVEGQGPEV